MLYHSINRHTGTKEKQECPETDLYLGRVVLSDRGDNIDR